jgi:SAM-dependent methyltransferase
MKPSYWDSIQELFGQMKWPMRPDESEIAQLSQWFDASRRQLRLGAGESAQVLLLGVTAEIVQMPWPDDTHLTAVDNSDVSIRAFWPGDELPQRRVIKARWEEMPFAPQSFHFVLGDCVFNSQRYPDDCRSLASRISQLLKPGGCLFVRVFTQSDPKEDTADILSALREGKIADYHELRFRLLSSMQADANRGVIATKEAIDQEIIARGMSLEEVYERTGYQPLRAQSWLDEQGRPVEAKVYYPTVRQFEDVLAEGFELLGRRYGSRALAFRCPIFGLRKPV